MLESYDHMRFANSWKWVRQDEKKRNSLLPQTCRHKSLDIYQTLISFDWQRHWNVPKPTGRLEYDVVLAFVKVINFLLFFLSFGCLFYYSTLIHFISCLLFPSNYHSFVVINLFLSFLSFIIIPFMFSLFFLAYPVRKKKQFNNRLETPATVMV